MRSASSIDTIYIRTHMESKCIRSQLPLLLNNTPGIILSKINTHSIQGFSFFALSDIICHNLWLRAMKGNVLYVTNNLHNLPYIPSGTHKRGTCKSASLKIGINYISEPAIKTNMNNFIKWICPSVRKTAFALNTNIWIWIQINEVYCVKWDFYQLKSSLCTHHWVGWQLSTA